METPYYPQIRSLNKGETFNMKMPECCTSGVDGVPADDCIHVSKSEKPVKRNIGL